MIAYFNPQLCIMKKGGDLFAENRLPFCGKRVDLFVWSLYHAWSRNRFHKAMRLTYFGSADLCPQCVQACLDVLVTAVNLCDVVNAARAFRCQGCNEQGDAGADVRT